MARPAPEPTQPVRKRQLNIIYFVDSARTRSLTIPLGRVRFLGALLAATHLWAIAAIGIIGWLNDGRLALRQRLSASLTSLFEYESRYDDIFERAYDPSENRPAKKNGDAVAAMLFGPSAAAAAAASHPNDKSEDEDAEASSSPGELADKAQSKAAPTLADGKHEEAESQSEQADLPQNEGSSPRALAPSIATISNPIVKPLDQAIELTFDLVNKSGHARAEGFVWAVAEFKTTQGQSFYIGAPATIDVEASGEPSFPERASSFGIRFFKKKTFHFSLDENQPESIVGIRIGVMNREGKQRSTYKVPVDFRVSKYLETEPAHASTPRVPSRPG